MLSSFSLASSCILTWSSSASFSLRFACSSLTLTSFWRTSAEVSSMDLCSESLSFSRRCLSALRESILAWTSSICRLLLACSRLMSSRCCAIYRSNSLLVFFSHLIFSTTTS